jgi:hypothetical protein
MLHSYVEQLIPKSVSPLHHLDSFAGENNTMSSSNGFPFAFLCLNYLVASTFQPNSKAPFLPYLTPKS